MVSASNGSLPGDLSSDLSNKRPLENRLVPKYKARRVSAVRDFPTGCGPDSVPVNADSEENGGNKAAAAGVESSDTKNKPIANREMAVKIESNGDAAEMPQPVKDSEIQQAAVSPSGVRNSDIKTVEWQLDAVNNTADVDLPESLDALVGDAVNEMKVDEANHLASVVPRDIFSPRSVSAVRDFPPGCGKNVSPTEEVGVTPGEIGSGKNEITVCSADKNGVLALKNSDGGPHDDNGVPEITPISMFRSVPDTSGSDSNSGSAEPVGKDIVVYPTEKELVHVLMAEPNCPWSEGQKTVSEKMSPVAKTSPVAETSVEKNKEQNIAWRLKGKSVAKKTTTFVKPVAKKTTFVKPVATKTTTFVNPSKVLSRKSTQREKHSSLLTKKKKLKKVCTSYDADENPGTLVLAGDEEKHSGKSPKKLAAGHKKRDFEVNLPPFGPNSSSQGDARDKVRNTLRIFSAICRKILQQDESNSKPKEGKSERKKANRIDLIAARAIKDQGQEVNTGKPILGDVPGVEVGDEFQFRTELAVVGIHRLYQAGIDSIRHNNNLVATSIVSSGAYTDDLENADVLVYSGQGGNVVGKQKEKPEDQKLERGNLALKNSIDAKTPVRVIRGWKEKALDPLESKPKMVTMYVYDGLYTVTKYWTEIGPHGKHVFMFELRRNPGQPELAWKELKKTNKSKSRPGVCIPDISGGKEPFAICAVNMIDEEKPPTFNYIPKMMYPDWYNPSPPGGCDCTGRCSDSKKCKCAVRNGGEIPYNRNGALVETKHLVFECGPHCKCPPSCYNRVSQRGIRLQLDIFKTELRGWGVRALTSIPSGSFICEYAGELLQDTEAEKKIGNDEYLFDIGQNLTDLSVNPEDQVLSAELKEEGGFTIDACQNGNVGRFINHCCAPNLYAQNVVYDHDDLKTPHIMLYAMENIPPLKELTYHYNYSMDEITDSDGNIKVKKCYCGAAQCTGRMY